MAKPRLWSLDEPYLYTAVTRIFAGGTLIDESRTPFGIRTTRFDPNHGFFLNGKPLKLKGVCLHHDLGALGAAFSEAALERRLKALKELGVNAIRCSHNPMAPEEYDLCDRLGLLMMDEAFDEWTAGKHKWIEGWNAGTPGTRGYHEVFEEWSDRDISDMVLRDRNHPSIVLWSIGNEIDYPGDPFGHPLGRDGLKPGMLDAIDLVATARRLIADVKRLDGTRPVTEALADTRASNATGLASLLDVAGYNYLEQYYAADHKTYPERVLLGSENSHSLDAWRAVAASNFVAGQFLWTGIDYLGESERYPDRGSAAGLLDLCGFRKPLSYLREALWSARPMVYVAAREPGPARATSSAPWPWWNTGTGPALAQGHSGRSLHQLRSGRAVPERPLAGRENRCGPAEAGAELGCALRSGRPARDWQARWKGGRAIRAGDGRRAATGGADARQTGASGEWDGPGERGDPGGGRGRPACVRGRCDDRGAGEWGRRVGGHGLGRPRRCEPRSGEPPEGMAGKSAGDCAGRGGGGDDHGSGVGGRAEGGGSEGDSEVGGEGVGVRRLCESLPSALL